VGSRLNRVAARSASGLNATVLDLPSGTVTLLFSDIEGSTALLGRLGSVYADVLDAHRALLRRAWSDHGGVELGTEGDGFYVVFTSAPRAAAAAVDAQRALDRHAWPKGEAVRVRIGFHTGAPVVHGEGYVGMDVHLAARVAAAAHGGQILLSDGASKLVAERLPAATALLDLGPHRLKDIPSPERIHQLTVDGLREEFPPPRTLGSTSRLPEPDTPLMGRDAEIAYLVGLLASPTTRLVTLTGPGGVGKTRLAIAVAERLWPSMSSGVYIVDVATVTSAASAWPLVAESLGLPAEAHSARGVAAAVADRQALFILDNLEQVAQADGLVADLLSASPRSRVIATSRRPMHMPGEREFPVPPLDVPNTDDLGGVAASPAVRLFVEHAQRVRPSFELNADNAAAVAAVCRRLDGLPLGVELVAARTKLLTPSALLHRLRSGLDMAAATRLGSDRQKTLRSAISWSYELLDPAAQRFFRRLGAFSGGADLNAVSEVTQSEQDPLVAVSNLLDASLVSVADDESGEPRVKLLETIRAYALDMLAQAGDLEETQDHHARHFLAVAGDLVPRLETGEYQVAKARLAREVGNLREALNWTLPEDEPRLMPDQRREVGVELCAQAVWWEPLGYSRLDGLPWLRRAIERDTRGDGVARARCLTHLSSCQLFEGDVKGARDNATLAVGMCRRLGDADPLVDALSLQAMLDQQRGAMEAARSAYQEALRLARNSGNKVQSHGLVADLAILVESHDHDSERALRLKRSALALAQEIGSPVAIVNDGENIAASLRLSGRPEEALAQMRDIVPEALNLNSPSLLTFVTEDFAAILAEVGQASLAARLLAAADASHANSRTVRLPQQDTEIAEPLTKARAALTGDQWNAAYAYGYAMTTHEALREAWQETRGPGARIGDN
jgi:predicted ATPase/class 3 adenylate cyclase